MNQGRKIYSLQEDFQELGLLNEQELNEMPMPSGAPVGDPRMASLQKKKLRLKKKELQLQRKKPGAPSPDPTEGFESDEPGADLGEMGACGDERPKGKMDKMKGMMKGKYGSDMASEDDDGDLGEDDLDEASLKRIKKRFGAGAITARKAAKKYYRKFKGAIGRTRKKFRKSALGQRLQKLSKKFKHRKGYRLQLKAGNEYGMDQLGSTIDALKFENTSRQFSHAYYNVVRLGSAASRNYGELSEDYISYNSDFSEIALACEAIALEAKEYAEALKEHDDSVTVSDQELISEHLEALVGEISDLVEMYEYTKFFIDLDEGLIDLDEDDDDLDEDDDDDDLDEMYAGEGGLGAGSPYDRGYSPQHAGMPGGSKKGYKEYGEDPYKGPAAAWKNDEVHQIGNTMHPLGWHQPPGTALVGVQKLTPEQKAMRARQTGLGYGLHLGGDETYTG